MSTRKKPTTAAYMARVYLAQARTQRHRGAWHATLLNWAAKCRREHARQRGQIGLI